MDIYDESSDDPFGITIRVRVFSFRRFSYFDMRKFNLNPLVNALIDLLGFITF